MNDSWKMLALVALATYGGVQHFKNKPEVWESEKCIDKAPSQQNILSPIPWTSKQFKITPLARYEISARVIQIQRYYFDHMSSVSPIDFGVAWGVASNQSTIDEMTFIINDRYLSFRSPNYTPELSSCIANMHLLPANERVESQLKSVKLGQGISMSGYLVSLDNPNIGKFKSSLTRSDSGPGACEIMWVETIDSISPKDL
jgi:hypothetical protein